MFLTLQLTTRVELTDAEFQNITDVTRARFEAGAAEITPTEAQASAH